MNTSTKLVPSANIGSLDADGDGLVTAGELGKWEPENDFVSMLGIFGLHE